MTQTAKLSKKLTPGHALSMLRTYSLPLVATLVCLPLIVVVAAFFIGFVGAEQRDTLAHLWHFVIGEYIWHTFVLMVGVGILVTMIGVSAAWLTTVCDFKGVSW